MNLTFDMYCSQFRSLIQRKTIMLRCRIDDKFADVERSPNGAYDEALRWFREHWDTALTLGQWWEMLAESGWGQPTWPVGRGGRGLSSTDAADVVTARRVVGAMGGPAGIATMLAGPTLLAHGTNDQIDRYLPGILSGRHIWCQLFSEPGAGSDLASLRTRAEQDGDHWIVNGQKVWTSGAHRARYGILIARTDPDQPKHRGISYFVIDMHQPGVDVKPLREMTGRALFNEVFLTDAIVNQNDLLGNIHDGWRVALTTLTNERNSLGGAGSGGGGKLDIGESPLDTPLANLHGNEAGLGDMSLGRARGFELLVQIARDRQLVNNPVVRQELSRNFIESEVARISALRIQTATEAERRGNPAALSIPLVSIQKLAASKNLHRLGRAALNFEGAYAMLSGPDALVDDRAFEVVATAYMISIGGGTDQIQRNIIGERVLGLPGEPRVDKDVAFRDLLKISNSPDSGDHVAKGGSR